MNTFNQGRKDSVCRNCSERSEGCHSVCERYLAERANNDDIINKRALSYEGAGYAMDEHRKHLKRLHKRTRGRMR